MNDPELIRQQDIPGFSRWRAIYRLIAYVCLNLILVPLFLVTALVYLPAARAIQRGWADATMFILGFDLRIIGQPRQSAPTLFAANHVSYFDIAVFLRACRGTFVAKSEITGWPLFGLIGRITKTIFIKRDRAEARKQRDELVLRLRNGENLIFFPEGTSTEGSAVSPFKSSLFGVAEDPALQGILAMQPISISYAHSRNGVPLTGALRGLYAWFGDATMVPHFFRALAAEGVRVEVRFHPPVEINEGTDRKQLAAAAYEAVASGVSASQESLDMKQSSERSTASQAA